MSILKTEAIVLKSFDFRETSRIATFFTRDYGKVKGVLKGIRKDPRKFSSSVDRFTVNDIVFYHYSRTDLHLISHCDLKQFYFPIRQDYRRAVAANYMLELVEAIMPAEERNEKIYRMMLDFLESLAATKDIDKLIYIFQIKTLLLSGFRPHIDSCVKCRRKIQGRARFSLNAGGLVCPRCPAAEKTFTLISSGTIASILHIEESDWPQSLRLTLTAPIKKELKYTLNNFLVHHLERHLNATRFLS